MNKNRWLNPYPLFSVGLALLAIGSIGIGLRSLSDLDPPLQIAFLRTREFVLVTVIVGLTAIAIACAFWCIRKTLNVGPGMRFFSRRTKYFLSTAGVSDLPNLYEYYVSLFGPDLVPIDQMSSWMKKNPEIAWRVMRLNESSGNKCPEMIGFFDIEPLTSSGESKLRAKSGHAMSINKGDIHSGRSYRTATAYYIGSVGSPDGSPPLLQGICMVFFIRKILDLAGDRTITVYARPARDEGVYLVRELFHMNKRHQGGDMEVIWSLEVNPQQFKVPESYAKIAARIGQKL